MLSDGTIPSLNINVVGRYFPVWNIYKLKKDIPEWMRYYLCNCFYTFLKSLIHCPYLWSFIVFISEFLVSLMFTKSWDTLRLECQPSCLHLYCMIWFSLKISEMHQKCTFIIHLCLKIFIYILTKSWQWTKQMKVMSHSRYI